ncbi:MAG TPA: hypothetical protein VG324_08140 [Blastocatellia bacterium]|nr:hypothetical protein [Blastocatellia bacterium]
MKRPTQILLMALAVLATYSLSRAQDEPLWKYITSIGDEKTGGATAFFARDCYRFTDAESEKYPKLAVKRSGGTMTALKETVDEFDCKRRATRIRIWIYTDDTEQKEKNLDWTVVVHGSVSEGLLDYACRNRKQKK